MKIVTAIIFAYCIALSSLARAELCQLNPNDEITWTQAQIALSGDMLLVNNRQISLIGIQAPAMGNPNHRTDPPQPLSQQAQRTLNHFLALHNLEVGIVFDQQVQDAFGRMQAHVFLPNGQLLAGIMAAEGMALAVAQPPNLRYQACLFNQERQARTAERGLWALHQNSPELKFPLAQSNQLSDMDNGFRIIRGEVVSVTRRWRRPWQINLDTTGIRIPRDAWSNFNWDDIKALEGQMIEVRGNGFAFQGGLFMTVEHPNMINRLNTHETVLP
ncbi:thermonuclease family protein [Thiomicrospira sp. ALE5]|uniref:thermonuclease family protein n=1 Tax=Thiomicrospira sp. ALE5 TaxID=748650 RepID=UPI0008EB0F2D|nr:thermonuclease family protein [Thiomicrospira sp. ALE5]SFR55918.1 Endonuclease YncB, thermonuclease family [Thiomicrospira sp. ALE5]